MATWGNNDNVANSVTWATSQVSQPANSTNQENLFGNSEVGLFAVDVTEQNVANGSILDINVTNPGSGYTENATVIIDGNATATSLASATGTISSLTVTAAGSDYNNNPDIMIDSPAPITFNANSNVNGDENFISITNNIFQDGDKVTYSVDTGNTALGSLTGGDNYYITSANTSGVKLSKKDGGRVISLEPGETESGHSLTGETAEAIATISGSKDKGHHAGWVLRTVGTGGRAGRVQTETLVAMGSIVGDAADDTEFKDS